MTTRVLKNHLLIMLCLFLISPLALFSKDNEKGKTQEDLLADVSLSAF
jgi:hypothetical protein